MSFELDNGNRKPFDVVPDWSPQRKEAFIMYRDMGADRSLRGCAQALQKDPSLLMQWSSKDGWRMRVAAWDAEQDRVRQDTAKKEIERVTRKHARALESTITVLMQPALKLAAMIENGDESMLKDADPILLANLAAQAGKQLPALVTASRLVHGVSTQNIDAHTEARVKLEGATPADLDTFLLELPDGTEELDVIEGTAHDAET